MPQQSVSEFVASTAQKDGTAETFTLETSEMLEVNLHQKLIWAKLGSMIAYTGQVNFSREGALDHGIGKFLKKKLTGEGAPLMKMEGIGRIYLADRKKKITILNLSGESVTVNGNDLLAMEDSLDWDIEMMGSGAGMMAGGLFNVTITGNGMVAIMSQGKPLTLKVEPGEDLMTDPQATVAWSGTLSPQIKTNASFKAFLGRGSGETFQLRFSGNGWVVVQPSEETSFQQGQKGKKGNQGGVLNQLLSG